MTTNRLEAFSDGVMAIIITIMVLEFKVPNGNTLADLLPLKAVFTSYILCFAMVGIYWNNHHHLLQTSKFVNGTVMWANLHLLFWLSLVPFCNSWMGQTSFAALPTFVFGLVLFLSAMRHFADALRADGVPLLYRTLDDPANRHSLAAELDAAITRLRPAGPRWGVVVDPARARGAGGPIAGARAPARPG
jgi:hypothetical protein